LGEVAMTTDGETLTATLTGSSLVAAEHNFGLLLIDAETGAPLGANYVEDTEQTEASSGEIESVTLELPAALPAAARAYLMIDAYPAALETITF
jgi:hypothetical protein